MKKIIFIIAFFVLFTEIYPQTNANWFFGKNAGVNFNTDPATIVGASQINQQEGCATISDAGGNLLFYSDGVTVWNKDHEVMQNGTGLHGHYSSLVSAYIVKQPGHDNIYYLFTIDVSSRNLYGVQYSIIDMNQNNDKGRLISKNNSLYRFASPKFAATPHANGRDIWIVTTKQSTDKIIAILLTDEGFVNPFIETKIGKTLELDNGFMKFNCEGDKLYMVNTDDEEILIVDFDDISGEFEFSNQIHIDDGVRRRYYSLELSPDNSKLYVTTQNPSRIYRFSVNSENTQQIEQSLELIASSSDLFSYGGIQLAPNDTIYIAKYNKKYLSAIGNPNSTNYTFIEEALYLENGTSLLGLPTFMKKKCGGAEYFLEIEAKPRKLCEGDTLKIMSSGVPGGSYYWEGPYGFSSTEKNIVFENVSKGLSGIYTLTVNYKGFVYTARDEVIIEETPKFEFVSDSSFCKGDSTSILIKQISVEEATYEWSTGKKGKFITVAEEGTYYVYASSNNGCATVDSIEIVEDPPLYVEISGIKELCEGQTTTLEANYDSDDYKYEWKNKSGEVLSNEYELEVSETGDYYLEVEENDGCKGWDTVFVMFHSLPNAEIKGGEEIKKCGDSEITLEPVNLSPNTTYFWNDGIFKPKRQASEDGEYILTAQNQYGCISYDTVSVVSTSDLDIVIMGGDTIRLCKDESIELEVMNVPNEAEILWSTGETTPKIIVSDEGEYEVIVSLFDQCFDTARVYVKIDEDLDVQIIGATEICEGEPITLSSNYNGDRYEYQWSTGETTESIEVSESGDYILEVISPSGCQGKDTIEVNVYDKPDASLNLFGKIEICDGDNIEVYPTNIEEGFNYYWSDGFAEMTRIIENSGRYVLYADNDGNCIDSSVVDVDVIEVPKAIISAPDGVSLCLIEEITLNIENYNPKFNYEWSTGETTESILVSETGWYKLEASNSLGCKTVDSIEVIKGGDFDFEITASSLRICNNSEITISATDGFSQYEWSTGETTRIIEVNKPGIYSVTITDELGCTKTDSIYIEEYNIDIEMLNQEDFNFGEICFTESISKTYDYKTLTDFNVNVESISIEDNSFIITSEYKINNPEGSLFGFTVEFKPKRIGKFESELKILINEPCEIEFTFKLAGSAYSETVIDAPEINTDVDIENHCIPFEITELCKIPENTTEKFNSKIRFNNKFFNPIFAENAVVEGIEYVDEYVDVEISGVYDQSDNTIFNVCGHTLIGSKEESDIEIVDFQWDNDFIRNSTIDGKLSIRGVCKQEFFNMKFFETTDTKISPNPARDDLNIKISTEEEGKIKIYLMDIQSNIQYKNELVNQGKNDYNIDINIDELSSGVYYLQVISPYSMTTSRIIIVK